MRHNTTWTNTFLFSFNFFLVLENRQNTYWFLFWTHCGPIIKIFLFIFIQFPIFFQLILDFCLKTLLANSRETFLINNCVNLCCRIICILCLLSQQLPFCKCGTSVGQLVTAMVNAKNHSYCHLMPNYLYKNALKSINEEYYI